jgi:hypothetical protein
MQFTKESVIEKLKQIKDKGWIPSGRARSNVGAVGNTLEDLFGIEENNLPIADAGQWELKSQRRGTSSLTTLFHSEPSPRNARIVPKILLPLYGWAHEEAGTTYPITEMSFRSTTPGNKFTDRGFKISVDRSGKKVKLTFVASKVSTNKHSEWLSSVQQRVGLGPMNPQPYWDFDDLKRKVETKIKNAFYVLAECRKDDGKEYFYYDEAWILEQVDFNKFLDEIEKGTILVDFDARTGHNHGTKFRMYQGTHSKIYRNSKKII